MEKLICALRSFFCKDAPGKADASNEAIKVIADDDQQQASKFTRAWRSVMPHSNWH